MGVMADLSGNASEVAKPPMADRKFANVDMDNFDDYMESVKPAVHVPRRRTSSATSPDEQMGVKLTFKKMADFEPAAIARQVPALRALLEAREQLANLQRYMDGKVAAEDKLRELLVQSRTDAGAEGPPRGSDRRRQATRTEDERRASSSQAP